MEKLDEEYERIVEELFTPNRIVEFCGIPLDKNNPRHVALLAYHLLAIRIFDEEHPDDVNAEMLKIASQVLKRDWKLYFFV